MTQRMKVGIIGCGTISKRYVTGCHHFEILDLVACADIYMAAAEALAVEYGLKAMTVSELLADPEIELVINLTIPAAHAEVTLAAIAAGKHVQSEKPLAVSRSDGQKIVAAAKEKGVLVGCAPDTFLGGGLQTCRKVIDDGWIGQPVGATAFMMGSGPERWHPNPGFLYQVGAGPLFDMGPYYLTALIHLLGPIERVAGASRITFPERIATSPARFGEVLPVEVPTFVTALLNFASGPIATLVTTFDVIASVLPRIEVYGSEGTLQVPDPNTFGGPVRLRRLGAEEWSDLPLSHSAEVMRGIGAADLAYAAWGDRPQRASDSLAFHVLDLMHAIEESAQSGRHVAIESRCDRPAPLPLGLLPGRLDP
jgi:predicted dehydrogenase